MTNLLGEYEVAIDAKGRFSFLVPEAPSCSISPILPFRTYATCGTSDSFGSGAGTVGTGIRALEFGISSIFLTQIYNTWQDQLGISA